ncbi:MAG: Asp-tRNA(Asn)/Glu-tRNA(Gln) amidotransferase subunit GatA [Candidatus Algichlamydia australiensis]|nr:Asp-tRNA(Asn)/Glu-tRNA(Gln) amidotransferase subunit GatA [Chlamydiales bacterium]
MLYKLSATQIREKFLSGELSAEEIVRYFLERAKTFDKQVHGYLKLYEKRAIAKAKALDEKKKRGEKLGLLAGVPIAVKDNIQIKGEITTCASKFLENYVAPFDATVVENIENQDGIIIGKTNLDEFAMGASCEYSAFGPTHNPWQLDYTPGGSSGGSAAVVSARFAPISLGSDTGGSIRQPASFTGTVGFKSTFGRVSRNGLVAFGSSFDQIGPFTNDVEDVALIMEVLGRPCKKDATSIQTPAENYFSEIKSSIKGKKVGIPWGFVKKQSEEIQKNFNKALKKLTDLGVETVEVDISLQQYAIAVYYILSTAEASTNLARFDGVRFGKRAKDLKNLTDLYNKSRCEGFGAEVKKRILLGTFVLSAGYQEAYYKKAQKVRTLMIKQYKKAFESCDVIALPTTPTTAFEMFSMQDPFKMYLQDACTIGANVAGLPAVSVPSGYAENKCPLGLQFLGPQMADTEVMRFAYNFQNCSGVKGDVPPLFDKEHAS